MRLLVIEDETELGELTAANLTRAGFTVDLVGTLEDAAAAATVAKFDLTILDLGLPDGDGISYLADLRARGDHTPVLVLTARDAIDDRVAGLDAGADDYLLKPFAMPELVSRVKALMRRPRYFIGSRLDAGNVVIDTDKRWAEVDGAPSPLSRREFALLETLMRNENRVVSRGVLEDALYGFEDEVGPNALEVSVHRLRRRLEHAGADVRIHTVRGVGYMLDAGS